LAAGVAIATVTILTQYYRQNTHFSYHFRPGSKNCRLCVRRTPRSGRHLRRIPVILQLLDLCPPFCLPFLVVSLKERTSIKPLSRLASASVSRSQRLAKTTVRLPKRLASSWPEPCDPGLVASYNIQPGQRGPILVRRFISHLLTY